MINDAYTINVVQLLRAQVIIASKEINGILDGGASISIISLAKANELGLTINKTFDELQTANGVINPFGKTDPLSVSVHGSNCLFDPRKSSF